jgi:hypothetical protein
VVVISTFENYDPLATEYTTWTEAVNNSTVALAANPQIAGINTSAHVLEVTMKAGGWVAIYSRNLPAITVTSSGYRYFHCKLLKKESSKILVETTATAAADGVSKQKLPLEIQNTGSEEWQEFTVNLLNNSEVTWGVLEGDIITKISFQAYKANYSGGYPVTYYIDDIYFSDSETPEAGLPTGLANTPSKQQVSVSRLDNNTVKITAPESDGKLSIKIYNLQGQLVKHLKNIGSETFEVNLPANNIYLLQTSGKSGISTIKF